MKKRITIIILSLILISSSTAIGIKLNTKGITTFEMVGTVDYIDIEGGFWGIYGDWEIVYKDIEYFTFYPTENFPEEYKVQYLRVKFTAEPLDIVTIQNWGLAIKILNIEEEQEPDELPDLTFTGSWLDDYYPSGPHGEKYLNPVAQVVNKGATLYDQKLEIRIDTKSIYNDNEKAEECETLDFPYNLPLEYAEQFDAKLMSQGSPFKPSGKPSEHDKWVMSTRFIFILDPDNLIEESNEDNNRIIWESIDRPPKIIQKYSMILNSLFRFLGGFPLLKILFNL